MCIRDRDTVDSSNDISCQLCDTCNIHETVQVGGCIPTQENNIICESFYCDLGDFVNIVNTSTITHINGQITSIPSSSSSVPLSFECPDNYYILNIDHGTCDVDTCFPNKDFLDNQDSCSDCNSIYYSINDDTITTDVNVVLNCNPPSIDLEQDLSNIDECKSIEDDSCSQTPGCMQINDSTQMTSCISTLLKGNAVTTNSCDAISDYNVQLTLDEQDSTYINSFTVRNDTGYKKADESGLIQTYLNNKIIVLSLIHI
mgnify:FL=1